MDFVCKKPWSRKILILMGVYLGMAMLLFVYLLEANLYQMERININILTEDGNMDQSIIKPLYVLIHEMNLMKFPYVFLVFISIIPAVRFYQYYMSEKSMLTILRLPGRWTKGRFYWSLIKDSIIHTAFLWLVQLMLLLLCGVYYNWRVPNENQMGNQWWMLWEDFEVSNLFPFQKPWEFVTIGAMVILLPTLIVLIALAERSRKQRLLAVLGSCLGIYGVYYYVVRGEYGMILIPCITLVVLGLGIYYLYHKEIV